MWRSQGHGTFEISPADDAPRGAQITLHLKKDAAELADPDYVRGVVRKYSSFVQHPIKLDGEVINSQKPIWVEPPSQLSDEDYARFYQHLSHRPEEQPLWRLHVSVDSPIQFHAVVFCPPTNLEQLGLGRQDQGLSLCAKRVLVQNDCRQLLPGYLRFLCGLVDSEDLPLNVSRETLQDNTVFRRIRTTLVNQTHTRLQKLADENPADYAVFYRQFGSILREGMVTDPPARDKIAKLLRFTSSHTAGEGELTSLEAYIERAPDDQQQIYFIGGPDLATLKKNPNLEMFASRGLEVLFLTDTVDEYLLTDLAEYDGRKLTSIDAADVELPESAAAGASAGEAEATTAEEPPAGFQRVLGLFRSALEEEVQDVRQSKRLTDSPCCLVNPTGGISTQMQKLVQLSNSEARFAKRILEVNAKAPLVKRLCELSANDQHEEFIKQCGRQLFDNALVLEGLEPEPREMVARVQGLLEELARSKSPIIQ